MPILDPSLMAALITNKDPLEYKSKSFILNLIQEASQNINRNLETIESAIQFKTDIKKGIKYISNFFGLQIGNDEIDDKNIYEYFYSKIDSKYRAEQNKYGSIGTYYLYGSDLHFFQPCIELDFRSWYLTNTKVAIICIHYIDKEKTSENLTQVSLETDLMIACGYSVVIVIQYDMMTSISAFDLIEIFKTHHFAEIHLILDLSKIKEDFRVILEQFIELFYDNYDDFNSYFYFYSPYFNEISQKATDILKKLKQKPFFQSFSFSLPVINSIDKKYLFIQSNHFVYSKSGFDTDLIFVQMQNVPLYNSENEELDFTPNKISGFKTAYMNADDFLNWNQNRVEVLFNDEESSIDLTSQFVDFDDLHSIKIGSYVRDTLSLTQTEEETLKSVDKILDGQFNKFRKNDEFKKENMFVFLKENKILKLLIYVSYAYSKHEIRKNARFSMHKNQIFTAFEACKLFLDKSKNDNSGVIYQVETGEGKSCIICLIASLLALMKKTVHITSSNITLANRDYHESFEFFKMLGLKSAVLLHYNELPVNLSSKKKKEKENEKQNEKENQNQNQNESEKLNENENNNQDGENKDDENDKEKVNADNDTDFTYNEKFYPPEFFKKKLFNNSSNMNFSVCGINNDNEISDDKANIVFSTFVNFESLYLKLMEIYPGKGDDFFGKCSLIIDEADSILIDELTNGTILSRSMKTNGSEVLKFVYENYFTGKTDRETYDEIKVKYPKCKDVKIDDVKDMYSQIKLVNQEEFQNGKKYSIETKEIKEKLTLKKILESTKEFIDNVKDKAIENVKSITKNPTENDDDNDDDENEFEEVYYDEELPEITKDKEDKSPRKSKKKDKKKKKNKTEDKYTFKNTFKRKVKVFKEIIPFDYDHKGVLEPNKEFSGFVQQFIAIKEMFNNKENKNMIIKDVSMNYLYVSHPIFVNLYGGVCGLTGTIGNRYDKKLLKEQYKLTTKKIPRNKPNLRIEYPVILCDTINERNIKIASEVINLHKKDYPVLVIFQDLNEISALLNLLSNDIKNINIFDGKDEKIKPDRIAGLKGAVSLGTNVCGRGTDIKNPVKPLHVIITYFTSNTRVMNQAFGRTARQGQEGSVRIICLQNQYVSPIGIFNKIEMESILIDFKIKNEMQQSFINRFKVKREWIFSGGIKTQKFTDEQMIFLRKTKINVNRLRAFNFEFPICMSIPTFLLIQAQKIFSLYNCPNCKYTWILFQKYIREMILESWSLFIEKTEKKYYETKIKTKFADYLSSECDRLYGWLLIYLPESSNAADYEIVPTFMHIFKFVKERYEEKIMDLFPKKLIKLKKEAPFDKQRFVSFTIGFKPYSLVNESGARINILDGNEQEQTFIQDPELKYIRKQPHHRFSLLSITERIDDLFNLICKKINDVLGSKIGLKFFLRRTLGGCEFGVCYDFNIENKDSNVLRDINCIVDKDPLLLFTVTVKSMIPILAGILIIGLVYIASISGSISEWIMAFPVKLSKELVVKTVKTVAKMVVKSQIEKFCGAIISFLQKQVIKQIAQLRENNSKYADIFMLLLKIAAPVDFSNCGDAIGKLFEGKNIGFKASFTSGLIDDIPIAYFLKIGFLVMMCFATFMINFYDHKQSIKYNSEKESAIYDEKQDAEKALEHNKDLNVGPDKPIDEIKIDFKTDINENN